MPRPLTETPPAMYAQWAHLPMDPKAAEQLLDDEIAFFKNESGIHDTEALKAHILAIRDEAFKVHPYPCIRRLTFASLRISGLPAYSQALEVGRTKRDALMLDLGCCFGNDARKAISDGFPAARVVTSDVRPEFWALGHQLFRTDPLNFPVKFIMGNVFDDSFCAPHPIERASDLDLANATTLNDLQGRFGVIHASALFHLFDEAQQVSLAQRLAALLSTEPGSVALGTQGGVPNGYEGALEARWHWAHSPATFRALLESSFPPGTVRVEAESREYRRPTIGFGADELDAFKAESEKFGFRGVEVVWSVTRL